MTLIGLSLVQIQSHHFNKNSRFTYCYSTTATIVSAVKDDTIRCNRSSPIECHITFNRPLLELTIALRLSPVQHHNTTLLVTPFNLHILNQARRLPTYRMSISLLSLPGEVRNEIYRLALFDSDGLDYAEDDAGVAWLCVRRSRSATPSEQCGHIMIQETEDEHRVVANQLQFVCRQLRSETRSLSIRYNDINFRGYDMSPVSAFLESLPVYLRSAINRLNVSPKAGPEEPTVPLDVIQFCHDQPRSTVHFYHPQISSSSATRLLFTAFMIKHTARGDTAFVHKLSEDPPMRHYLQMLLDSKIAEYGLPCVRYDFR
jgi:hypothetical protein